MLTLQNLCLVSRVADRFNARDRGGRKRRFDDLEATKRWADLVGGEETLRDSCR